FLSQGFKVALIGHMGVEETDNTGYVEVDYSGCIDLRDKLSIKELICLLKHSEYLFSNDSAPIHIAASGNAFIGFIASCKHPDYITHYRNGIFGYKTKNFGLDGPWNYVDTSPIQKEKIEIKELQNGLMEKI